MPSRYIALTLYVIFIFVIESKPCLFLCGGEVSEQPSPMGPPENFEGVLRHDDVHQVQGLSQDQPCLSLTKLIIQPHASGGGEAAVIDSPPHGGGGPEGGVVGVCLPVGQELLGPTRSTLSKEREGE